MKSVFSFESYDLDLAGGTVYFYYALEHSGERILFTDTVTFSPSRGAHGARESLTGILDALHIMLGISYWKLYCPRTIMVKNRTLSRAEAVFWNLVYTKGLGEFFYANKLNPTMFVQFPFNARTRVSRNIRRRRMPERSLVLIGGGKDSLVTVELLRAGKKPFTPFLLNDSRIQQDVLNVMRMQPIVMRHTLDPKLCILNKRRDTYDGHIPVSAVYALAGVFAAALYGYRFVIASNEHSADYGNVTYRGVEINHQWSKSLEFETALEKYLAAFVIPDIQYFSLLRPFSEVKIAELFCAYKKYFPVFSSCNRNFKITGALKGRRWCGQCPKCAFVFAALAAFLPKRDILHMFGKDLFADRALLATYEELLGIKRTKPFECVGTPEETTYAFLKIHERGEFENALAMRMFTRKALRKAPSLRVLERRVTKPSQRHTMPKEFASIITRI